MPTPTVINQYRFNDAISRNAWDNRYRFDNFRVQPITAKVGGGAATGTAGDNNVLFSGMGTYEWFVIGTQTILAPSLDAFGLNLVQDAAAAGDGMEFLIGQTALCPISFTVGQDAAFFFEVNAKVQDVSGVNPFTIGFRKVQAFDATLANYTDFANIGIVGTAGDVQLQTQIATAGVVTTDTTLNATDATQFQLRINVSSAGVVTYQYNYGTPTVVAAYTFAANTVVVPYIRFTQAADLTTQASLNYYECGFQS